MTGTFTITVTANDGKGGTTPTSFTLTVAAPANVAPVLVNPIPDQYIDGGTYLSFSVDGTFYDPDSALIYSATGMPAWLTFNATTRVFSGTSGTKFDLTQTITVKATESPAGASATTTFVLSVTNGGSSLLASDPNTTTASSSPTPAKQKFALGNPSTTHANAEAIEHANTQAGLGAGSAGTGGVSALLAEPGEPGSPPEPPPLTPPQIQTTWYTYDAENRVQVVQGKLENGQIVLGDDIHSSYEQRYDAVGNAVVKIYRTQTDGTIQAQASQYDLRGNKTTDLAFVNLSAPPPVTATPVMVRYHYSATNQLEMRSEYYAPDTKIQVRLTDREGISFLAEADISGMLASAVEYSYDADGRLTGESNWERPTTVDNGDLVWVKRVANHQQGIKDDQVWVDDQRSDENLDEKLNSTSATNHFYDIAGRAFKYEDATALLFTYTTTYEGRDSYLESTVSGTSSDSRFKPTTNTLTYDAAGRLLSQREHTTLSSGTLPDRMRYYSNNAEGMVQSRRDGRIENGVFVQGDPAHPDDPKPNYQFVNASGQQLAQLREGGEVTLAATKLQAASTRTEESMLSVAGTSPYAAGGGKVLVQEGDTLSSLAQRVYGNRSLWYVLAQANGLGDPDEALTAGTALNAPSVSVNKNDAGTFRPYNPAEAIGSTSPELPFIDPPKQGCNVLATLIVVAVTAAVMAAMGPAGGGFIGGFVGNLAGQVAGMALGVTDHISLRSAIGSGLTAALTAGIAGKLGGTTSQLVEKAATVGDVSMAKIAASALLTAGANVAGSRVSGTAFSWKAIAANAVSDVVSASLGHALHLKSSDTHGNAGDFRNTFANRMVGGIVSVHTRRQFGFNDRIDYGNIAADAFGNALGNAVARVIKGGSFFGEPAAPHVMNAEEFMATLPGGETPASENIPGFFGLGGGNSGIDLLTSLPGGPLQTGPQTVTVKRGDTLSGILGTSNPTTIGEAMRANGLKNSAIYPGQTLIVSGLDSYSDGAATIGQAALNQGNAAKEVRMQQAAVKAEAQLLSGSRYSGLQSADLDTALANSADERAFISSAAEARVSNQTGALLQSEFLHVNQKTVEVIGLGVATTDFGVQLGEYIGNKSPIFGVYAKPGFGLPYRLNGVPGVSGSTYINPSLEFGVEVIKDGVMRRPYVTTFDLKGVSISPALRPVARSLPYAGLVLEGFTMDRNDAGDKGHLAVSSGVTFLTGLLAAAPETSGLSLVVGGGYMLSDMAAQHYEYGGLHGWRAVGLRLNDSKFLQQYTRQMERVYKADPNFERGPKE